MASGDLMPLYWTLFEVLSAVLLATRPRSPLVRALGLASLAALFVGAMRALMRKSEGRMSDHGAGAGVAGAALAWLVLWVEDAMAGYRFKGREDVVPAELPFWRRVCWAESIIRNTRNVGWNTQLGHVPPPVTAHRGKFILLWSLRVLHCLILLDLSQSYLQTEPYCAVQGTDRFPSGFSGYLLRCACLLSTYTSAYAVLKLMHTTIALVCVSTGVLWSDPASWRFCFGTWSDAYTLRRFWGRTWHQNLRRIFKGFADGTIHVLGIKRGTQLSSYTQVYVAFFLSGVIHVSGDIVLGGLAYAGRSMPFFLMQAVAITLEDIVIAVARVAGFDKPTRAARVLGYVWVFVWFSMSIPWYQDWQLALRPQFEEVLPFSVVRTYVPPSVLRLVQYKA